MKWNCKMLTTIDETEPYLDTRFINNQPLDNLMNNVESNPYLEVDSILSSLEDNLRSDEIEPVQETDIGIEDSIEKVNE